jgi:hypothetical protein
MGEEIMRQSCIFGFIGVLALMASAGWLPPASAQAPAPATTASASPFGKCNPLHVVVPSKPTDPNAFDSTQLMSLDGARKQTLLTSGLPCTEIVDPTGPAPPIENLQRGFDFYSWLTFMALNAPAVPPHDIRTSQPDTRAVWEDGNNFIPLLDVMLPGGAKPEWDPKKRFVPPACRAQHDADPSLMVVKMIEESFNQPFKTGPLIDQNNNYAIFDILMNKAMFDYIVDDKHPLYSRALQSRAQSSNLRIDFPPGRADDDKNKVPGDHGSIMVKVSWKILGPNDDKAKFHHVEALVAMPTTEDQQIDPPCLRKTLGLVGFHVVHKTKDRPQWIWTSFEHADNVPEQSQIDEFRNNTDPNKKAPKFNFYTLSCNDNDCPVNETPPRPWDPEPTNGLQFRRDSNGHAIFNSQIVRTVPLTEETNAIDKQFHAVLGDSVWKNYILIGTQWPSDFGCATHPSALKNPPPPGTDFDKQPDMNCAPAPTFLANSTLETYSQGQIPQASSSCMACHGNATSYLRRSPDVKDSKDPSVAADAEKRRQTFMNQSDFTFMLEKAR